MNREPVIRVEGLVKRYGDLVAVDGVSFEVYRGEIFCLVGPNGAGKTTTIECLEGLRRPDGGRVAVLGLDPSRQGRTLKEHIGIQLQEAHLPDRIRVWEALDLFASFYRSAVDWRQLLRRLGLEERRRAYYGKLSGGQKQRLFIALALLNDPDIVFLDELTTGLDPQARRAMWDLVRDIREQGKTVFLTTHFMEEAERLADRVAIMDHGRIVALDSPENLIRTVPAEVRLIFTAEDPSFDHLSLQGLDGVARVERSSDRVVVYGRDNRAIVAVVSALVERGVRFRDMRTETPTLEDVFLALTGREMRD